MKELWTFDTKEKFESFVPVLEKHGIAYELQVGKGRGSDYRVSVDESDLADAKRLLLKHRKRRTSADSN